MRGESSLESGTRLAGSVGPTGPEAVAPGFGDRTPTPGVDRARDARYFSRLRSRQASVQRPFQPSAPPLSGTKAGNPASWNHELRPLPARLYPCFRKRSTRRQGRGSFAVSPASGIRRRSLRPGPASSSGPRRVYPRIGPPSRPRTLPCFMVRHGPLPITGTYRSQGCRSVPSVRIKNRTQDFKERSF